MLYPVFILSPGAVPDCLPEEVSGNRMYHVQVIDHANAEAFAQAYKMFSGFSGLHAAAALLINQPVSDASLTDILSLTFIAGYYRINSRQLMFLTGDDRPLLEDTGKRMNELAAQQGIDGLAIYPLTAAEAHHDGKGQRVFSDPSAFSKAYADSQQASVFNPDLFFCVSGSDAQPATWLMAVAAATSAAQSQFPELYAARQSLLQSLSVTEQWKIKYALATAELNNTRMHLEVMRSGSQASVLQAFYKNEYDILPLWYKRFGQLLKVGMGKRTFRSLFNDQVKKYKD